MIAEMQRRELEAELGSARAMALLEAESKRKMEEVLEQEKRQNVESLRMMKQRVGESAWEKWAEYFSSQSAISESMEIDEVSGESEPRLSSEEISEEERASLLKDFKPFHIRAPLKKRCVHLNIDVRVFTEVD